MTVTCEPWRAWISRNECSDENANGGRSFLILPIGPWHEVSIDPLMIYGV